MALTSTQRWIAIGCAGVATLAAMSWVDNREKQLNEVSSTIDTQAPDRKRSGPSDENTLEPETPAVMPRAAQLRRAVSITEAPDLFAEAGQPPAPPTAVSITPTVTAAPETPTLPFIYLGRITEDGVTSLFLAQGERNLVVKLGETVDEYRLERLTDAAAEFIYLPKKTKQSLTIKDSP